MREIQCTFTNENHCTMSLRLPGDALERQLTTVWMRAVTCGELTLPDVMLPCLARVTVTLKREVPGALQHCHVWLKESWSNWQSLHDALSFADWSLLMGPNLMTCKGSMAIRKYPWQDGKIWHYKNQYHLRQFRFEPQK